MDRPCGPPNDDGIGTLTVGRARFTCADLADTMNVSGGHLSLSKCKGQLAQLLCLTRCRATLYALDNYVNSIYC